MFVAAAALAGCAVFGDFDFSGYDGDPGATGGGAGGGSGKGGGAGTGGSVDGDGPPESDAAPAADAAPEGADGATGENCDNGMDDDGDGLEDCADPECAPTHACAPPVPAGWTGPVAVYDGPAASAPACAGAWSKEAYKGGSSLDCPSHSCSPCGCGTPSNVTCGGPTITWWSDPSCSGTKYMNQQLAAGSCFAPNYQTSYWTIGAPPASGGTCSPTGGVPTKPGSLKWLGVTLACQPPSPFKGGCPSGVVCLPKVASPLGKLCIYQTGDAVCPLASYTKKIVAFGSFTDARSCSTCSCAAPAGVACAGTVRFFNAADCKSGQLFKSPAAPSGCTESAYPPHLDYAPGGFSGGSCAPSGGQPVGSCTPTQPTTICCVP